MSGLLWKFLGIDDPPKPKEARRKEFREAFQDQWVSGALGTFFFVVARSLSADLWALWRHIDAGTWRPTAVYTLDRTIRYGYLVWLVSYFFVAALENKPKLAGNEEVRTGEPKEVAYDIVQYVAAFAAAVCLGFVMPEVRLQRGGLVAANLSVVSICGLALILFGAKWRNDISRLRWLGLAAAVVSVVWVTMNESAITNLVGLAVLQLILWFVMYGYIRLRLDKPA